MADRFLQYIDIVTMKSVDIAKHSGQTGERKVVVADAAVAVAVVPCVLF